MYVNVTAAVVPVGVGADDCLMTGKVFFTEIFAKCLCHIYGQAVVGYVLWVKADDVVMAFDILPFLIFAVTQIGSQTGNCKILLAAVEC